MQSESGIEVELAEAMRKFKLTSKEQDGISLEEDDVKHSEEECQLSIVGKVFDEKTANIAGIRSFIVEKWNMPRWTQIAALEGICFRSSVKLQKKEIGYCLGNLGSMTTHLLWFRSGGKAENESRMHLLEPSYGLRCGTYLFIG